MRRLAAFVLLLQLTSLVSAAGVCICDGNKNANSAEDCCVRPSRPGADCCAPDRLTSARTPSGDASAAITGSPDVAFPQPVSANFAAHLARTDAPAPQSAPQLILRI